MWVMTSFGIFMPSMRPSEHVDEGDDRLIQIRARRRRELAILIDEYMPQYTVNDIVYLRFTDYEYRVYCTHAEFGKVMEQLALNIDYVKFKDTTKRYNDSKLHVAYLKIWNLLYREFSTNNVFDQKRSKKR